MPQNHVDILSHVSQGGAAVQSGMRSFVLAALWFAVPSAANDVEVAVSPSVVPVGKQPALTIKVNKDLAGGTVELKSTAGVSFRRALPATAAGKDISIELPQSRVGRVTWKGTLAVTFADDTSGSMPLSFATEVLGSFKFVVKDEDVNLKEHSIIVTSEHETAKIELEIYGDEGELLAAVGKELPRVKAGTPMTVEWIPKKAGDVLRIHITVTDPATAFQTSDIFPYTVTIPHEDVEFETGKADVRAVEELKLIAAEAEIKKAVQRFAAALDADAATIHLTVTGHTDTVGSPSSNRALSDRRAQAIAKWFARRGVKVPAYARGAGEDELKVETPDETDEQKNRRVDYDVGAGPKGMSLPGWTRVN
jgi:outer membrane protein OmpA-like peptidoglycan-associated protein